jgi:hypothetical protein
MFRNGCDEYPADPEVNVDRVETLIMQTR